MGITRVLLQDAAVGNGAAHGGVCSPASLGRPPAAHQQSHTDRQVPLQQDEYRHLRQKRGRSLMSSLRVLF